MANPLIVTVVGIIISMIYFIWEDKKKYKIKRKRKIIRKRITANQTENYYSLLDEEAAVFCDNEINDGRWDTVIDQMISNEKMPGMSDAIALAFSLMGTLLESLAK